MRTTLFLLAIGLVTSLSAGAATLQTSAAVQLISSADAQLDHWTDDAVPTWAVTGAPDEHLQVSVELQTADGRRLTMGRRETLALDAEGHLLTTLAAPATTAHDAIDVVTLVICRE